MMKRFNQALPALIVTVLLISSLLFLNTTSFLAKNMNWDDDRHGVKPTKTYAHLQWDKKAKDKEKVKDKNKDIVKG